MKARIAPSLGMRHCHRSGFALVLVLFCCAICVLLLIILADRVSVNTKSTSAYSDSVRLRALSEMAVNLVQAQIRDATTDQQTVVTALTARNTWASQPGAIRVYTPAGSLASIYKLYSSQTPQTTDPDLTKDVPADWFSRKSEYTDLNQPVTALSGNAAYPILNPASASLNPGATGIAGGFSIKATAPVATGVPNPNAAPMPVRWIYVLADGTLCQLGDPRISLSTNPITGRVAYWTDDETAKVNLNTAAPTTANSYWDAPRARGAFEDKYIWYQPSQNEYQRYPGHPATVSLRAILGSLGSMSNSAYYDITARYNWGGSEDGGKDIKTTASRTALNNKEDRLYASVDELLFKSTPVTRRTGPTPAQVESLKFFLTTSSRASELNLFGQPRVSIWPIDNRDTTTRRTPFDRLIAFCSTIGQKPYYFTRERPLDPLYDYQNLPRNQELYAYLQRLTDVPIPGFGGSTFASKYGADRDQILTGIFDYIRCTNLNETFKGRANGFQSFTPFLIGDARTIGADPLQAGAGFVVPIRIGSTRGAGRFPAIQGASLWFVRHQEDHNFPESATNPQMLQAVLVLKTTTPMHGYMPFQAARLTIKVANSIRFSVAGNAVTGSFSGGTHAEINTSPFLSNSSIGRSPGGYDGAIWTLALHNAPQSLSFNDYRRQPVFSNSIAIGSATTFDITGGNVDVEIAVGGSVIQNYRLYFDSISNLPLPTNAMPTFASDKSYETWWNDRGVDFLSPAAGDVVRSVELRHGDARIALMAETSGAVPFQDFTAHPDYLDVAKPFAHGMRGTSSSGSYLCRGATAGSYVGGLTLSTTSVGSLTYTSKPDIPSSIGDLLASGWSGDYDNGISNFSDGPFLNKPDEGTASVRFNETTIPYSSGYWTLADGFFSPLRQVPSAVMFGSLPTGVKANIPWRTLLFCPNPRDSAHAGFSSPADHLLLDLFRMPVVEPLAMSGPASTNGKINMNYAIAPFSYIRRATSWHALLESMKMLAIPDAQSAVYKGFSGSPPDLRNTINVGQTLEQFETRFAAHDIFRSATEICRLFIVPQGKTLAEVRDLTAGFWSTNRLTGDNSRERPYAELYPKLTTQSNTYSVHIRVQILPRSGGLPSGKSDFEPLAEYRGSRLVERFLNPENPRFALASAPVNPDTDCLNELYQFRVLEEKQFSP